MNDIRTVLRIVARRLELTSFVGSVHLTVLVIAAVAALLMLADRSGAAGFVPWIWVAPLLVAAALGAATIRWAQRRRTVQQVALAADDRLDLAEKLSTAIYCQGRTDPFAQAAIEDAVHVARDPRTREAARRKFAVGAPRGWWLSPLLVLVAIMFWMLPQFDLFSEEEIVPAENEITKANSTIQNTVEALVKPITKSPELAKEMEEVLGQLTNEGFDPDAIKNPEQLKREAIKKVTDLNKKLDEILSGEKGKTMDSLRQALQDLKSPAEGAGKDLADALSEGNFSKAQEALKNMMKALENGDLTEAQKEQLGDQLQDMANQLQNLAQQQKALEKALQQAGLDPKLAGQPQALQQALKNAKNLNQQQMQQLQQMAQAQQAAAQMCQGLGQACQQMAQGMQGQQGQGQKGMQGMQGMGAMGDQLNQLEQMQMMLQQAQAAANACKGQMGQLGQGLGMCQMPGGAFGRRGQGAGGKAPMQGTPTGVKTHKGNVKNDGGDIIARMFIDGAEFVGDSKVKAKQVVAEKLEGYDEALQEEYIPPQYRAAHQHYFGELKKMTEAEEAPGVPATPDQPAEGDAEGAAPAEESGNGE